MKGTDGQKMLVTLASGALGGSTWSAELLHLWGAIDPTMRGALGALVMLWIQTTSARLWERRKNEKALRNSNGTSDDSGHDPPGDGLQ